MPVWTVLVTCTLAACQVATPLKGITTTGKGTTVGDCSGGGTPPELQPGATIAVTVQTADGQPAAGVQVTVAPKKAYALLCAPRPVPGNGFSATTDATGLASQAFQRYGTYVVTAKKDGRSATGEVVVDQQHAPAKLTLKLADAAASPPPAALLQAPKEPSTTLAGVVSIDAAYTLAHGGSLLSDQGGGILAVGGSLISDQGGGLISDHGGAVIANNSGNIIANNSGGLVANNGGGLTGKTKRRLLADAPAPGASLPAAGMLIRATDLATHQPVPLGVDGAGQPVYAVYTNLNGAFQIYVPASEQGNLLLSAEVPGVDDARLSYQAVAPAKPTPALPIDEDANVTTHYVREGLIGRMVQMMTQEPGETLCLLAANGNLSDALKGVIAKTVTDVHAAAAAAGITAKDNTRLAVWALAARCADAIIAQTDLESITLGNGNINWGTEPNEGPEPALDAMNEVLAAAREAAAKQLASNPRYFDTFPYLQAANACDPGRYQVLKPADLSSFMVDEFLSRTAKDAVKDAGKIVEDLGAGTDAKGVSRLRRIRASADAIALALSQAFVLDTGSARTQMVALIKAYQPTYQAIPGEPKPFVIQPSCIQRESCVDPAATP